MQNEIAVLIPAYNEGPRINVVLDVVCNYSRSKRVVVIDDGSTDDTAEKAGKYPVELISYPDNQGKGAALQKGIAHVGEAPSWLFLDADLIGLNHGHMDALLAPLEDQRKAQMSVGMLVGKKTNVNLAQKYFGILNGQRGLSDSYVKSLPDMAWSRFGVEIFLSKYAEHQGKTVDYPVLQDLTHHTKEEKFGFGPGFVYRLQMYKECLASLASWKRHI